MKKFIWMCSVHIRRMWIKSNKGVSLHDQKQQLRIQHVERKTSNDHVKVKRAVYTKLMANKKSTEQKPVSNTTRKLQIVIEVIYF